MGNGLKAARCTHTNAKSGTIHIIISVHGIACGSLTGTTGRRDEKTMNEGNSFRFDLWLYNEMQKRGWNSNDLAGKTGLSRATICFYLADERIPTLRTFALLLKAFGKHVEIVDD